MIRRFLIGWFVGLTLASPVAAVFEIRTWTTFRQEDGLGHNAVTAGLEDRNGAIWIATLGGGISRYDGRTWKIFGVEDGLPGNLVMDIQEGADGRLWAALGGFEDASPRAIAQFVDGTWQAVEMPDAVSTRQVQVVGEQMVCVVTDRGQMMHYDGADWHILSRSEGRSLNGVQCLFRADDGAMWVAYQSRSRQRFGSRNRRLGIFQRRLPNLRPEGRGPGSGRGRGRGGGLWRGALGPQQGGDQLGVIDAAGRWQDMDLTALEGVRILTIVQGPDRSMWFGTEEGGVLRYREGVWETFTMENGLPNNRVEVVAPASDGSVWVGTRAGVGRYVPEDGTWQVFTERNGLPSNFVTSIWHAKDGSVWVGTRSGVARYGETGWVHHPSWGGAKDPGEAVLERDGEGRLWAATSAGIYRLEGSRWRSIHSFPERGGRLVNLILDGKGTLWAANASGVLRYDGSGWQALRPPGRRWPPVIDLSPAREGGVWVSLARLGVYRFDGTNWTAFASDVPGPISAVYEAEDGAIWLGSEEGVVRIGADGQREFRIEDGLPQGRVIEIAGANGQIWVSIFLGGVARFDGQVWLPVPDRQDVQFSDVVRIYSADDGTVWLASRVDGAIRTDGSVFAKYTLREGLPSSRVSDICQDAEGQFWFATDGGLACYSPDREAPSTILQVAPNEVAPRQGVLFEFSGLDAWKQTPSWSLQYSWRLDGGDWSPFEQRERVFLERSAPGMHTFEVRAMDLAFNVEPMPVVHRFNVLAPVIFRPWFQALSFSALLAIAVSVFYAVQRHRRWRAVQTALIDELEAELQEAHDMQMSLLPLHPLTDAKFELAGRCVPANHVGGDYYQYFRLSEQQLLGFGAADVSGKAMKAAVRAMQLSGIFRYEFREARDPLEILHNLHGVLVEQLDAASFITCCLGVLDTDTGRVRLGNAAHPYPYHYSAKTEDLQMLDLPSIPLGLTLPPDVPLEYGEAEVVMEPGDVLVLYSDGVTDMKNVAGDFYEEDRLEAAILKHVGAGSEALIDGVIADLFGFKGEAAQTDDVTLLVIRAVPEV